MATKPTLPKLIDRTSSSVITKSTKSQSNSTSRPSPMISKSGLSQTRQYAQGGKIKK